MKSIFTKIKNLIPYLLLITTYFFFVNIEAKHDEKENTNSIKIIAIDEKSKEKESDGNDNNKRISIPVIPYRE
tara:strand:- start:113 stop:331 length:219 start_codon:yes stop_codon:yes gene_type:complete